MRQGRKSTGGIAVITGAASGFGLEVSRHAARRGLQVVMADVQADALDAARCEIEALGAEVLPFRLDVSKATEVEALAEATLARFGTPTFVFNNAGVAAGGLVWEASARDWEWVLGVNLMGVAHGVRVFTPPMLAAAARDPGWRGHIVNTASMAGLLCPPTMGLYSASKHAVVALTEALYHDLALVTERVHAHVLCPFYVPTRIDASARNRPAGLPAQAPTKSSAIAAAMLERAVTSGKVSAAEVAAKVFEAMDQNRFYIYSHPKALATVQTRFEDIMMVRNPSDPFGGRPELAADLRKQLCDG